MGKLRLSEEKGRGSGLLLCRVPRQPGAGAGLALGGGGLQPVLCSLLPLDLKLHPLWLDRLGLRAARRVLGVSAGSGQLDVLCVPGTEVPPFLSLGSVLCSQLPGERWGQKMGHLGCFHLTVALLWGRTAQVPAARPRSALTCHLQEAPGSWPGKGTAHADPAPAPARSVGSPACLVDVDAKTQGWHK